MTARDVGRIREDLKLELNIKGTLAGQLSDALRHIAELEAELREAEAEKARRAPVVTVRNRRYRLGPKVVETAESEGGHWVQTAVWCNTAPDIRALAPLVGERVWVVYDMAEREMIGSNRE